TDGTRIGTIERVIIDKLTGKVAYAVLSSNSFVGTGQERLPIPWERLTYDRRLGAYRLDFTEMKLSGAPSHESHKDFAWGDREFEIHGPHWGIAEHW
ncbi:MAG TPA: PRC-barrel domain-containing protein, partial [Gemmatimonadales bacterium]